jgi:hypothetical protein
MHLKQCMRSYHHPVPLVLAPERSRLAPLHFKGLCEGPGAFGATLSIPPSAALPLKRRFGRDFRAVLRPRRAGGE